MQNVRHGGCNCGAVRLEVGGAPIHVGLCHCLTCRRETGGPFMAFAVWDRARVTVTGDTASWRQTTDLRHFCPICGSALFSISEGTTEVEVRLGCLDEAPSGLTPTDELWVSRREPWQPAIAGAVQYAENRPKPG